MRSILFFALLVLVVSFVVYGLSLPAETSLRYFPSH